MCSVLLLMKRPTSVRLGWVLTWLLRFTCALRVLVSEKKNEWKANAWVDVLGLKWVKPVKLTPFKKKKKDG